jgi:nitroreductase
MDLKDCIHNRYACKKFDGRPLSDDLVENLMNIIRYAPSAFNLQTWKVKIISDPTIKECLQSAAFDQEQISTCSHLLIFCADLNTHECIDQLETGLFRSGDPADTVTGQIGFIKNWFTSMPPSAAEELAIKNTMIAATYAWLGAVSLGFDSCPMGGFDQGEFARILNLPKHLKPIILTPIGYRADAPLPKYRHQAKDFIIP